MFNFEHTHQLSETEYVAIWALTNRARPMVWVRRFATGALGVLFLFSSYTFLLGAVVLVMAAFAMTMPRLLPGTSARNFHSLPYLRGPLTYGADTEMVWARGEDFVAKVFWRHVTLWREREGWLVLQGTGFPPVLLPIGALRAQGVYDEVKALAREHAVEYDSAAARRQLTARV
jgi:hypothetical protein